MKKNYVLFLLLIVLTSCRKDPSPQLYEPENTDATPIANLLENIDNEAYVEARQIVLGKRLTNAYSVENMQRAFDYYNGKVLESRYQNKVVEATHYYIKILPETEEDLKALDELDENPDSITLVLHDYPLDYEILKEGEYYINASSEGDLYHPVYSTIPVGEQVPANLNYEIIDQLYKPSDDEIDIETVSLVLSGWKDDIIADFGRELTEQELPDFLNGRGNDQERFLGRRYRPYGWVKVQNTQINMMDPLKRAKISIGRSFWWRYTDTNDNGHFVSPKKYRGKVRIRAKWRSHCATIRTSWNEMLGFWVSDHLMTITRNGNGRTKHIWLESEHLWFKGTVHNGIVRYNRFCRNTGINQEVIGANVWVWKNGEDSATPMLNQFRHLGILATLAGVGEGEFWAGLTTTMVGILIQPIQILYGHLMPDHIYAGLKNKIHNGRVNTARIHQIVFHESSHFSHAKKAGVTNWANIFAAEFNNWLDGGDPYQQGVSPNIPDGKHIALAEGWASYMEHRLMIWTYERFWDNGTWYTGATAANYLENFNMYTVPMIASRDDNDSWFLSGLIYDITDNATDVDNNTYLWSGSNVAPLNPIVDNVGGISVAQVFQSLTSNVRSICQFKNRLTSIVGSSVAMDDLFESYGCN